MNESLWSAFDNISEVAILNSTIALPPAATYPETQTVPAKIVAAVGLFIFCIGICANSVVLAVLVRARRHFGSSVHTLIANQSAMDLFACVFGCVTLIMMITHGYKYDGNNRILDGAIFLIAEDESDNIWNDGCTENLEV